MSSSLQALASRAQQTVVDSLESIPAEYAQTMFVATGYIAAFVGFIFFVFIHFINGRRKTESRNLFFIR